MQGHRLTPNQAPVCNLVLINIFISGKWPIADYQATETEKKVEKHTVGLQ